MGKESFRTSRWLTALLVGVTFFGGATGCEPLLFYPSRDVLAPAMREHDDVFFQARDGTRLHGWLFRADRQPAKGTVVQFHGNAGNITSHHWALAWIAHRGYNFLAFDYRGYGESEGIPSLDGLRLDGLAALSYAETIPTKRRCADLIVVGQSLGGAVAVDTYAHFGDKSRVGALVLTSTFHSYRDIAGGVLWRAGILAPWAGAGFALMGDSHSPWRMLESLPAVPILIMHDERDPVIPVQYGETLYSLAKPPKRMWMTNCGEHVRLFDQMLVRDAFVAYLDDAPEIARLRRLTCSGELDRR